MIETVLRPKALTLLVAGALAALLMPLDARSQGVAAEDARLQFSLPQQPLLDALRAFGRQTQYQVLFDETLLEGRTGRPVNGSYTPLDALSRLLDDTGLGYVRSGNGAVTVIRAASREVSLPTVTVSGKASGSTTEGTGLYTTFSTSSSTRLNLTPQETPQAVTILTRQRMDDQGLATVIDALDATPGVIVQYTTYGQDGPTIYARGSSIRNYQTDGVPVALTMSPFLANTSALDRVEIVRGATGIMNGLGSPAATVNLVRKRPTAEPQVSFTTQAGNWNRYGAGVDASGALNEEKTLRARLVVDYTRQNAWVDRYKKEDLSLYGVGELDLTPDTLLTAGFSHLSVKSRSAIQGRPLYFNDGTRVPHTPEDDISQPWRFYDHESTGVFGSVEHKFGSGWIGKAEYSHTEYTYSGLVGSIWTADNASGDGSRIYASRWGSKPRQDSLDAYVTGVFPLLGRSHELIAGVTLSRLKARSPNYVRDPNYSVAVNYNDWSDVAMPGFTQNGQSRMRERQDNAFASTRFSLTDSTNLLLGGRLTHWELNRVSSAGVPFQQKENVFVPYAGLVHALDDNWSLYGSYTKIFRPQDYGIIQYNGAPMDPEEGLGYEAGVKASFFEGRLTSSLSVFQTKLKNLAVWNVDTSLYELQGLAQTRGVELEVGGELAKNWQLAAGYAYATTDDADGDRILTYIPRHSLKSYTTYRLPGALDKLTLGGGIQWQGGAESGLTVNHRQGSVTLVNLLARYEVSKHLTASFNLNNALGKRYYSTIANNYGTFGAPRSFVATLKYSL